MFNKFKASTLDLHPLDIKDISEAHIRISWYVTYLMVPVCLSWIYLGYRLNETLIVFIGVSMLVSNFLVQGLFLAGRNTMARVWLYLSGNIAVTFSCLVLPSHVLPETMYLVLIGAPFLNFSFAKERRIIFALVSTTFSLLVMEVALGLLVDIEPWIVFPETTDIVRSGILGMVIIIVGFEMAIFGILANSYQDNLHLARLRAEDASRAKGDFLAAMSHEIRTPMNGIIGMVDILEKSHLNKEQERLVETVRESSEALLRIIEDILDMSRIEAGKLTLSYERTEVLPLLEGSVETLRTFAAKHNVRLELFVDPDLPKYLSCDAGRLRQIILNLLSNGIKFSSRPERTGGGYCRMSVENHAGDQIEITVEDNGIGIDEEFQQRLFLPFEQQFNAGGRYGGSGLGLSIVNQLLDKMDGTIAVQSAVGVGTTFTITLPIVEPEDVCGCPDLTGVTIATFDREPRRPVWHRYVRKFGGNFVHVTDPGKIPELLSSDETELIFLLPLHHPERGETEDTGREAWGLPKETKVIFLAEAGERMDLITEKSAPVLQESPLLPTVFFETVAEIRGSQTSEPSGHEKNEHPLEQKEEVASKGVHVLVAEDNEINRLVLTTQLEKLGYSVAAAADGQEAWDMLQDTPFDLLLTDCQMPQMDGYALSRTIRANEKKRRAQQRFPVLALTANALESEKQKCLDAGMDGYLTKPVTMNSLEEAIENRLGRAENPQG